MPIIHAKPRRLTITISDHVYQLLLQTSDRQGRSLSNLAAYLLETTLDSTSLTGVQP
jgi:predicted CopG family antitoxin